MNKSDIPRHVNILNDQNKRDMLIFSSLQTAIQRLKQLRDIGQIGVLDVGAGTKRYEKDVLKLGANYLSHDFGKYAGNSDSIFEFGFREDSWPDAKNYNLVSDISELPHNFCEIALLTEVLEHVPNPVLALESVVHAVKEDGFIVVSVPSHSFVHQSPFYFSSGLSYYWFDYHCKKNNLEIVHFTFIGDILDHNNLHSGLYLPGILLIGLRIVNLIKNMVIRPFLSNEFKSAASIGVVVLLKKNNVKL